MGCWFTPAIYFNKGGTMRLSKGYANKYGSELYFRMWTNSWATPYIEVQKVDSEISINLEFLCFSIMFIHDFRDYSQCQ